MDPPDPRVGQFLLERFGPDGGPPGGDCPDANVFAGFVGGTLRESDRADVLDHLGRCADCRQVAAELAEAGVSPPAESDASTSSGPPAGTGGRVLAFPKSPRGRLVAAAVAAVAAAAVVAWVATRDVAPTPSTEKRLAAAAAELARSDPASFAGFLAYGAEERRRVESVATRGGLPAMMPAGRSDDGRPAFRWAVSPGARSYDVSVVGEDGKVLWRRTTERAALPYPADERPLPPGSYVWQVDSSGPAGSETGRRAFEVVGEEAAGRWARARDAIDAHAPADLRALLHAHHALREGRLADAERFAREALARAPNDAVARDTLRVVLRALGDPDAGTGR